MKNTINFLISLFLLNCWTESFSQTYSGQIITTKNDTIAVEIKLSTSYNVNKLIDLQDKIVVFQNGIQSEYLPKDLKGFKINLEEENVTFDNVDDLIFAQRLYLNKIKLYKFLKKISHGHIVRHYIIINPNNPSRMPIPAMGLSRLITKDAMLPAIEDCKISSDKIKNDEIKIKDEKILVDFIKDYENNCFQN